VSLGASCQNPNKHKQAASLNRARQYLGFSAHEISYRDPHFGVWHRRIGDGGQTKNPPKIGKKYNIFRAINM